MNNKTYLLGKKPLRNKTQARKYYNFNKFYNKYYNYNIILIDPIFFCKNAKSKTKYIKIYFLYENHTNWNYQLHYDQKQKIFGKCADKD